MVTVREAFDLFLCDRAVYASPATIKKYRGDMQPFFVFLQGRTGKDVGQLPIVQDFNPYREYILFLRARNVRGVTIRSYCRSISAFLRWCYTMDYCPDYLKNVKLPKNDARPKMPLYREEVARMDAVFDLDTEKGLRNYCIVHLMLDCGLRTQEVLHLKAADVLPDKNILAVMDSKGCKSRMVLVPGFLLDAMAAYCQLIGAPGGVLFRQLRSREPLTGNAIKMLFEKLKKECGIPRLHAHLLRHTFATSYLIGGGNLEFLRVFLGHADYAVTMMYSSMAAEYKMLGADIYRLDDIFFTRGY